MELAGHRTECLFQFRIRGFSAYTENLVVIPLLTHWTTTLNGSHTPVFNPTECSEESAATAAVSRAATIDRAAFLAGYD